MFNLITHKRKCGQSSLILENLSNGKESVMAQPVAFQFELLKVIKISYDGHEQVQSKFGYLQLGYFYSTPRRKSVLYILDNDYPVRLELIVIGNE